MKVYAIIGESAQTVIPDTMQYNPAVGEILMQTERPAGNYIAKADGTWEKVVPVVLPTQEERISANEEAISEIGELLAELLEGAE